MAEPPELKVSVREYAEPKRRVVLIQFVTDNGSGFFELSAEAARTLSDQLSKVARIAEEA